MDPKKSGRRRFLKQGATAAGLVAVPGAAVAAAAAGAAGAAPRPGCGAACPALRETIATALAPQIARNRPKLVCIRLFSRLGNASRCADYTDTGDATLVASLALGLAGAALRESLTLYSLAAQDIRRACTNPPRGQARSA